MEGRNIASKIPAVVFQRVGYNTKQENQPVFVSIDNTICQKTKPSLQAEYVTQGCDWYCSHADKKSVWGHFLVWLMIHTMTQAFLFSFRLYDKGAEKSKERLAIEMYFSLDVHRLMYVVMESWYPLQTPVEAYLKKGVQMIAMVKTNRILYPKGVAIQAKKCA